LIIGKVESIDCLIDELKKHEFNLKVEINVNEYLICCIEESFIDSFEKNFGEEIEGKRNFLTPGTPRFKIQRSTINFCDQQFSFIRLGIIH
jgi:hypothetical protein